MDAAALLAAVAHEFEVTGAATPPWPDPHPAGAAPTDDEYSRCLDPGKYRIIAARAEAWARALVATGLATHEPVPDLDAAWQDGAPHTDQARASWLRPHRPGAIPLLLAVRSALTDDDALLIGAGEPAALLSRVPDCGCDACDDGSEYMLDAMDDEILDVVSGALVYVDLPDGTTVIGGRDGWRASKSGPARMPIRDTIKAAIAEVRSGRRGGPAVHGEPWW